MIEFCTTIQRGDVEHAVRVRASVSRYSDAIGAPDELRGRYMGELSVDINEVVDEVTGKPFETTPKEEAALIEEAANLR